MVVRVSSFLLVVCVLVCFAPLYTQASRPKIFFGEIDSSSRTAFENVRGYLANILRKDDATTRYGDVAFLEKKDSLLGSHYTFRQNLNSIPIEDADIMISVNPSDKKIYRVYNNLVNHVKVTSFDAGAVISQDEAYDIAWKDLKVTGHLMSAPTIKLVYQRNNNDLKLVYKVLLAPAEPFGYWEYTINAVNGKIKFKKDIRLTRYNKNPKKRAPLLVKGPLLDRKNEFGRFASMLSSEEEIPEGQADGSGLTFDPDPKTYLADESLEDNSPAEKFEQAYVERVLKDLKVISGKYTLQGPFINIKDFEAPSVPPTTSDDGKWSFKRGDNGFNDVMTYYHIDQNQRYIQSLGFVGNRGIQNGSIAVDSNGLGGDDNSHFIPGQNRIAFGHGCVDDNEDADVILHEYGHSIQDSINRNWRGGDTGAMGEGFGDYWATSYSLSTQNGSTFMIDRVFQWDAGGDCWPGRRVNVADARYEHNRSYYAHQTVGSFVSDELWSTPLVQSLIELLNLGYKREAVDQIVLEAHFGLGANLKMRDMANSIVQVAKKLFPSDPYATVFTKNFIKHNILEVPRPSFAIASLTIANAGANGMLDPGEEVDAVVALKNSGTSDAKNVRGHLSTDNRHVILTSKDVYFGNLNMGETSPLTYIPVKLSRSAVCGEKVKIKLDIEYEDEFSTRVQLPIEIPVGVAIEASAQANHNPPLVIPDNSPSGMLSSVILDRNGVVEKTSIVQVSIDLEHSYLSDIKVWLIAPSGKEILLHDKNSGTGSSLVGTYPTTLTPADSLSKLKGEAIKGEWKLKAVDDVSQDEGKIKSWGLKITMGHQCS